MARLSLLPLSNPSLTGLGGSSGGGRGLRTTWQRLDIVLEQSETVELHPFVCIRWGLKPAEASLGKPLRQPW